MPGFPREALPCTHPGRGDSQPQRHPRPQMPGSPPPECPPDTWISLPAPPRHLSPLPPPRRPGSRTHGLGDTGHENSEGKDGGHGGGQEAAHGLDVVEELPAPRRLHHGQPRHAHRHHHQHPCPAGRTPGSRGCQGSRTPGFPAPARPRHRASPSHHCPGPSVPCPGHPGPRSQPAQTPGFPIPPPPAHLGPLALCPRCQPRPAGRTGRRGAARGGRRRAAGAGTRPW